MNNLRIGAIPIYKDDKKRLVLVTSRRSKRWIFPKGKREENMTDEEVALMEAYEEAGVRGEIINKTPFKFDYHDDGINQTIVLFPMKVTEILEEWPESKSRERKIVRPKKALKLFDDINLNEALPQYLKSHT